jgi:hypothetical protein
MDLALDADYPLLDVFWTMLLLFGWALFFYLLIVVFRHLFGRHDLSAWGKAAWVLLVLVLPIVGALAYLISQSRAMGEGDAAAQARMDPYLRSVTGGGGYHNIHETITSRESMAAPTRQDSA